MFYEHENNQAFVFIKQLFFILVFLAGLVVGIVVFIDPYGIYHDHKYAGINEIKPDLSRYHEQVKLTQAMKIKPDVLILGNSRAEIGFNPESTAFKSRQISAYNLAIRGADISVSYRELSYLLEKGIKPKTVLVALDFLDFVSPTKNSDTAGDFILPEHQEFPVNEWHWKFDSLFSMLSVKDAIHTLFIQGDNEASTMTARGFNPLQEYNVAARNEGYYVLFRQRAEENTRNYLRKAKGGLEGKGFVYLKAMLDRAKAIDAKVVVVIYPYHAQIMALFDETGLMSMWSNWKNQVVEEVENVETTNKADFVTVMDFSGYSGYRCERIPSKGDLKTSTLWYWEAGHFKKELGDFVLERSIRQIEGENENSSFGIPLDKSSLAVNLERTNAEKQACIREYPELFEDVVKLVSSMRI